ncbi:MAG: NTP transferase domain-containing protein [Phycisphaerae bacterium]
MPPAVGIVILAAGAATRFGASKQLLCIRGEPLVRRAARAALDSLCRPVVVVTGAEADAVKSQLTGLDLTVCHNADWSTGIAGSLRTGVGAMTRCGVDALVVLLADQPRVSADTIRRVVAAHDAPHRPIVACDYGGACGPPALFPRRFFEELCAVNGDEGARGVFARHRDELTTVAAPEAALDIDTPADAARLRLESPDAR